MGPAALAERHSSGTAPAPIASAEFLALLERLGPFERQPTLAVAVSGGADSLCLALLAHDWACGRGGIVTALIVDHGLRPESTREAATVAQMLEAHRIPSVILRWDGAKPKQGVQALAREARYRLLFGWCREHGALHLLLGHQRDDQIETMVLREERGSGPDGLAGMSAVVEHPDCRVLRPLLDVPGARLRATLRARGWDWIEDPSNRNPAFARVRVRAALAGTDRTGPIEAGRARIAAERETAKLLAKSVAIYAEGYAVVDLARWQTASRDLARRALVRLVLTLGGGAYAPRTERLEPVLAAMLEGKLGRGRTLGGCRLVDRGSHVFVCREPGRTQSPMPIAAGRQGWDDRFVVDIQGAVPQDSRLGALGDAGWRAILAARPEIREKSPLFPVPTTLPAVFDLEGVRAVPHLMYGRRGADPDSVRVVSAMFRPRHALAGPGFAQS
jgi:tRNA(Ile)-lysidine synthase